VLLLVVAMILSYVVSKWLPKKFRLFRDSAEAAGVPRWKVRAAWTSVAVGFLGLLTMLSLWFIQPWTASLAGRRPPPSRLSGFDLPPKESDAEIRRRSAAKCRDAWRSYLDSDVQRFGVCVCAREVPSGRHAAG